MLNVLCAALAVLPAPLLLQRSTVDLTPPERLPLGGYTERRGKLMEDGGDPLYARTVVLSQGSVRIAIVSAEMLTIPQSLFSAVQARIGTSAKVLLTATHTHCAPDSQILNARMTMPIPGIATFKRKWMDWYADRIAGGVRSALDSFAVKVEAIEVIQVPFNGNRGRRQRAMPDPTATLVRARTNHEVIPMWMHYSAHPVFYDSSENSTRGDWPGVVSKRLDSAILQGACGDASPNAPGPDSKAKIINFSERVVSSLAEEKLTTVWQDDFQISLHSGAIALDRPKPHPNFAATNKIPESIAVNLVERFAERELESHRLVLGKLQIAFLPAEPTASVGRRVTKLLRESFDAENSLVVAFTNGWLGYLLESDDYDRGGYEAELSFNGRMTVERVLNSLTANPKLDRKARKPRA